MYNNSDKSVFVIPAFLIFAIVWNFLQYKFGSDIVWKWAGILILSIIILVFIGSIINAIIKKELKEYIIDFIKACIAIILYIIALFIVGSFFSDKDDSLEDEEIEYYRR